MQDFAMKAFVVMAASALLFCVPASSKDCANVDTGRQPGAATEVRDTDEEDPNETLRRREEVTGSRLEEKVCRTRAEWKLHDAAQYDARRVKKRRAINVGMS